MKKLMRDELKQIKGGNPPIGVRGNSPCSAGNCGPELVYNCSTIYDENDDFVECCCGHSSYNDECYGA